MISIDSNKVEKAKALYATELKDFADTAVKKLKALKARETTLTAIEIQYLDNLIADLPQLVGAKTSDLLNKIQKFPPLPKRKIRKPKKGPKPKQLTEKIIIAMGYKELRDSFLAKYFHTIGIKACVYCNCLLTVTTEDIGGSIRAKFQVDHYRSKNTYPCFSISLYNLYPVCGPCNNIKKEHLVELDLYNDNLSANLVSRHKFSLDRASISKYITSRNFEDLKITYLEDPITLSGAKTFQEVFDISGIYNTQKDVAEELILKARIYNKPYKQMLINAFPKLFSDQSLSNRIIIGNYMEIENIHKRPMAKFTQDIARQLKLIK